MNLPQKLRAADVPKIVKNAHVEQGVHIVVFAVAALAAGLADFRFARTVGECGTDFAALCADVAHVGIYAAHVVQIVGEKFAPAQFHIEAPAIGKVGFETKTISERPLHGAVFFAAKLAFGAVFAEIVPLAVKFCTGVEIEHRNTGEQIWSEKIIAVTVYVRHKIELELRRAVEDEAFEREVAALLKAVFGVRVISTDLAYVSAKFESQPVVEIVPGANATGELCAIDAPASIEVAKVIGSPNPATDFKAAHLPE